MSKKDVFASIANSVHHNNLQSWHTDFGVPICLLVPSKEAMGTHYKCTWFGKWQYHQPCPVLWWWKHHLQDVCNHFLIPMLNVWPYHATLHKLFFLNTPISLVWCQGYARGTFQHVPPSLWFKWQSKGHNPHQVSAQCAVGNMIWQLNTIVSEAVQQLLLNSGGEWWEE